MRHAVLAASLLAISLPAASAEPLTWQDCVQETARRNPEIEVARELIERAGHQRRASYSPFLPQFSGGADYSRANSATSLQSVGGGSGVREEYSLGLSGRQNLFSGLRDRAGVRRARADVDAADAGLLSVKARVGFDLKADFARLLFAEQQRRLSEEIAARRRENLQLVEARYEAGREHKGSYLRIRAATRQAEYELAQAKRGLRLAQRRLLKTLGRDESDEVAVRGELEAARPEDAPDFRSLARDTPDHRAADARARSARAGVMGARSQFFPSLDAQGSASRRGNDWPPKDDRWSAGLGLSVPIFSGGRDLAGLKAAGDEWDRARADLRSVESRARLSLEDAYFAYQDAVEKTDVQKEFLSAAEVRSEISRSQYTSGLLSFEDWDLIENDLIANQKATLASRRDAIIAEAAWDQAQGKGPLP